MATTSEHRGTLGVDRCDQCGAWDTALDEHGVCAHCVRINLNAEATSGHAALEIVAAAARAALDCGWLHPDDLRQEIEKLISTGRPRPGRRQANLWRELQADYERRRLERGEAH